MDKIWHHHVIKYLQKKRLSPKDIHAEACGHGCYIMGWCSSFIKELLAELVTPWFYDSWIQEG